MSQTQAYIDDVQRLADTAKDAEDQHAAQLALIAAVDKLRSSITPPSERLFRLRGMNWEVICARLVVEMGVLHAIAARGEGGVVSASELAKETGHDALLITRLMRPLVNPLLGLFEEVGERTYAANATTMLFSTKGSIAGLKHYTDLLYPIAASLVPYLHEKGSISMSANDPEAQTPMKYAYGKSLFEYLRDNLEVKHDFDLWMRARRDGMTHRWFHTFPAAQILGQSFQGDSGRDALIVDIGGNQGHDLLAFRKAHRELPGRFVLQDLPVTLNNLDDPSAFSDTNVEKMEHDFFTPQPVEGALAYFFRGIFHDWDDQRCQDILRQTAKAMKKGYSRLLIEDLVLPSTGVGMRLTALDIAMLVFTGGMERTFKQWEALLDGAGLAVVKFWGSPDREMVIEAMLK